MTEIYIELGGKKAIAWSLSWPGWCRIRTSEAAAIQALIETEARYRLIAQRAGLTFAPGDLVVVERFAGDANTAWGVPSVLKLIQSRPRPHSAVWHSCARHRTCWKRRSPPRRRNCAKVRAVAVATEMRSGATSSKPSGPMRARSECDTRPSRQTTRAPWAPCGKRLLLCSRSPPAASLWWLGDGTPATRSGAWRGMWSITSGRSKIDAADRVGA